MIQYEKSDIEQVLNLVNSITVTGVSNMACVLNVTRILQNNGKEVNVKGDEVVDE